MWLQFSLNSPSWLGSRSLSSHAAGLGTLPRTEVKHLALALFEAGVTAPISSLAGGEEEGFQRAAQWP